MITMVACRRMSSIVFPDLRFGRIVQVSGGFIEDQDAWPGYQYPGDLDPLALPDGKTDPAFAYDRL